LEGRREISCWMDEKKISENENDDEKPATKNNEKPNE
jgi:hypothetical protein